MRNFILLFYILIVFSLYSQTNIDNINIGISYPYVRNENVDTIMVKMNFIFEILSYNIGDRIQLGIIEQEQKTYSNDGESDYLKNLHVASERKEFDYFIYSSVYTLDEDIIIFVKFFKTGNRKSIKTFLYKSKRDFTLNQEISYITKNILDQLLLLDLVPYRSSFKKDKFKERVVIDDDFDEDSEKELLDFLFQYDSKKRHEVYVLSGFLKNHHFVNSLFSVYTGYTLRLEKSFSFDFGAFFGVGSYQKNMDFTKYNDFDTVYLGTDIGAYIYFPGIIEPLIGIRVEFSYLPQSNDIYLSLPIDFGFKVHFTKDHLLRVSTSFPFNNFDIQQLTWSKEFTLGFRIGYARAF